MKAAAGPSWLDPDLAQPASASKRTTPAAMPPAESGANPRFYQVLGQSLLPEILRPHDARTRAYWSEKPPRAIYFDLATYYGGLTPYAQNSVIVIPSISARGSLEQGDAIRAFQHVVTAARSMTRVEQTSNIFHVGSTSERADWCRLVPICSECCREKPSKMVGAVGIEPTTSPV